MQADCRDAEALDEARWAAELAAHDPRVRGIVAYAPVHLGARAREAVAELAAEPGVVGVRRLLQDEPLLLGDPALAEGVRLLADSRSAVRPSACAITSCARWQRWSAPARR